MKIAQFYDKGRVRVGQIQGESLIPFDFQGDMIDFIEGGGAVKPRDAVTIPLDQVKMAPPVTRPSKIMALGLNYQDHAEESKGQVPDTPLIFAKFPNSVIGHNDEITWDRNITRKVDYEAELAVIIGETVRDCTEETALEAVFGYTCANDVSARDLQFGDGQWVRGKSLDTFCPLGPWVVTKEEIPNPHALKIQCSLNGRLMQDSNTGLMIFKVASLVSFMSRHFTLLPGDIILTGTPHGVGAFREPPVYMAHGDKVVVEIEGIGRLVNVCRTR